MFSEITHTLTKSIEKKEKKDNGIFFTPPKTINQMIDLLKPYMKDIKYVLEPSCGSCEFITRLNENFDNIEITAIELNEKIYNFIKDFESENTTILNDDFISYKIDKKYDLIIGNPPFFVKKKKDVAEKYYDYFDGRPNIFILFLIKSLKNLKKKGILSFILPENFLNCHYYNKTRKYINKKFKILNIIKCNDKYIDTQQDTVIFIVQRLKKPDNSYFSLNIDKFVIFGPKDNILKIKDLYKDSSTLSKLNFKVSVGNVVWNQCKSILTDDKSKTLLIYSSDIKDNKLIVQKYSNIMKKNYIDKEGIDMPTLLVNRGYGKGKYKFNYCLIEGGFKYLIENHLINISYNGDISKEELIEYYKKIIKSFENERTKMFIELYFKNNAINTTELEYILPIYI